jgi:riboflavin synthase
MFTGLVVERGRLRRDPTPSDQGGVRLTIEHSSALAERLGIGDSLAVNGVCLTLVEKGADWCAVELSPETLDRTTLGGLGKGGEVNLEPALRMGDALGGHWVQGHVDTTTEVIGRQDLTEHRVVTFAIPPGLEASFVEKGSVTLDGVSLTVAALRDDGFDVALIPHTLEMTTLGALEPGDRVNVEVDVLAKYVERAVQAALAAQRQP